MLTEESSKRSGDSFDRPDIWMIAVLHLDTDCPVQLVDGVHVSLNICQNLVQPILVPGHLTSQQRFKVVEGELYRGHGLLDLLLPDPAEVTSEQLANVLDSPAHHVEPIDS